MKLRIFLVVAFGFNMMLLSIINADDLTKYEVKNHEENYKRFLSKIEYYDKSKKVSTTLGFSLLLPGSGHIYAGKWWRGIPFILIEIAGHRYLNTRRRTDKVPNPLYDANNPDEQSIFMSVKRGTKKDDYLGYGLLFLNRIVASYDSYKLTKKYNNKLKLNAFLDYEIKPTNEIKYKVGVIYAF